MKKIIICFLLAIFLIPVNSFALTDEEVSTVQKLGALGIVEKVREIPEFYQPMRTIDVMSLQIKGLRHVTESTNDAILNMNMEFSDSLINLYEWQNQVDVITLENHEKIKSLENKCNGLCVLTGVLFFVNLVLTMAH